MNEKQQEAILSLNHTLLIAGAGSGKTFTIINKINYLLDNNIYKPDEILVISFTNESVLDIKNKINNPNLDIKTFHRLGLDILKDPNIKIVPNNYLSYIIDEYFKSYALYHFKTHRLVKHIFYEIDYYKLKTLIITFINLYKSNYSNISYLFNLYLKSHFITKAYLKIILDIYTIYKNELESQGYLDFNDMIIKSTNKIISKEANLKYKYIIIDEFQDTSLIRFNLIKAIIDTNNAKLFAVGDDYQSIYRFSGCDLNTFINLKEYLPNLSIINLEYNYRNNQTLINIANNFIIKNKKQIRKHTICLKDNSKPITIIYYQNQNAIISKIVPNIKTHITILGRNNKDKELFNIKEDNNIRYLTIHSSKGLEDDNIIIINLENKTDSLPSRIKNHHLLDLIILKDSYPFEEERRLFYVALTRSKNNVYLLVPYHNPSIFIKELIKDNRKYINIIHL